MPPPYFNWPFCVAASIASTFYALKAFEIFEVSPDSKRTAWVLHELWFNFAGSAFGWAALWVVIRNGWIQVAAAQSWELSGWDLLLAAVAFLGITGQLPFATQVVQDWLARLKSEKPEREGDAGSKGS